VLIIRHFFFRIIVPSGVVMVVSGTTALTVPLLVPIVVGTTLMRGAAVERLLRALQDQHRLLVSTQLLRDFRKLAEVTQVFTLLI
jgi:hypothetical protein